MQGTTVRCLCVFLYHHAYVVYNQGCYGQQASGSHFSPVDLRWGLTDQCCQENLAVKMCLEYAREAQPFFIALVGERYGWCGPKHAIVNDEFAEKMQRNVEAGGPQSKTPVAGTLTLTLTLPAFPVCLR